MNNFSDKKQYINLNIFLVKDEFKNNKFETFLKDQNSVTSEAISDTHDIDGIIFIKRQTPSTPKWKVFAEDLAAKNIDDLNNLSSSAAIIIRANEKTMIFAFGYGRFLIDSKCLVQDFGIKTALNTLDHNSLKSVDLLSLDEQAIQKKSQASREASANIFGIDISKDVLRAVTGSAKDGVPYKNISGGDSVYSFGIYITPNGIPSLINDLYKYYKNDEYKANFEWVDNIRRVKDSATINKLDDFLLSDIKSENPTFTISIPEIIKWDEVLGFSFTRSRTEITPTINTSDYIKNLDTTKISIEKLKIDKIILNKIDGDTCDFKIYNSIYYENSNNNINSILFNGVWYEIKKDFSTRIEKTLSLIKKSSITFPPATKTSTIKKGKPHDLVESEGDYNTRISKTLNLHLLDKKLIKNSKRTTPIELCDLLSNNKDYIHVKHRKGGSAGLSHLFSQGFVSSELLLSDEDFRLKARAKLKNIKPGLEKTISTKKFKSNECKIVYLILGDTQANVIQNLPFFSKINLANFYESLTQRGFQVNLSAAEIIYTTMPAPALASTPAPTPKSKKIKSTITPKLLK